MRRYLKISLLLLIINSLFLVNVHALENDVGDEAITSVLEVEQDLDLSLEEAPQVEDSLSIEDIINLIPDQYDLPYTQEDAIGLCDLNANPVVINEIDRQLQIVFQEHNISLDALGIFYMIERLFYEEGTDYTIFQYQITLYSAKEENSKVIFVTYSNTQDYNLEDEELVNQAFLEDDVLEVDKAYDFYTEEVVEEEELSDIFDERLPDSNYSIYFEETSFEDYDLSMIENGYTYLFINKVFYRVFPTIFRYYYRMIVSPEVSNADITNEVVDKLEELRVEVPDSTIIVSETGDVYSNNLEDYYGYVEIEKINKKDKTNYLITEGSNKTIVGNTSYSIKVDALMSKFIKVLVDGNEINNNNYSILNHTITLSSNYISSLNKGKHSLVVRFSDGDSKTHFTLKEERRVEPQPEKRKEPYYPTYYNVSYRREVSDNDDKKEVKEEKEEKKENEVLNVLKPNDVVKNETPSKEEKKEEETEEEEENNSRFNMNSIPIIIVALAFVFGIFGGYLYKKSLED